MAAASNSVSLKEYLKRYENPTGEENKKKKKKKKETKANAAGGVRVVDEDPIWQKPIKIEDEEENDSADEDKPQIDEDVEVKRMKRLEEIRSRRPYLAISDDGSGWVTVSDSSKQLDSGNGVYNMFPPHQDQGRSRTSSAEPMELNTGSGEADLSPPRQRCARFDTPSPSPELKLKRSDSPDLSPPRRSHPVPVSSDSIRKDSEIAEATDLSPPRRSHPPTVSSDFRRKNSERNSSPDLSPPRRSRPRTVSSDLRRKNSERDSSDLSPPRSLRPSTVSSDFRRKSLERNDSPDLSPPRLGRKHFPEVDTSYAFPEADLSPPRKAKKDTSSTKVVREAGLLTQEEMKEDIAKKKKEELLKFSEMDPSISGRGAGATYRFQGQRISKEEFLKLHEEEKPKEKKIEWGKGLAQKKEAEARKLELELEKDKPFARTKDDPELDNMLKERIRWGDPMAHLVKRKNPELFMEDLGDDEKMQESGFIIPQTIPSHSWIKRGIDPPGNRYGIRPGRHWDGVDRSNGFEKESFKRQNDKRATEREAYLWSVSDM